MLLNQIKNAKQWMTTVKRTHNIKVHKVKADDLSRRYPVMMSAAQSAADDKTLQKHHKAIEEELTKPTILCSVWSS